MAEENTVLVSTEKLNNTAGTFRNKMGDINSAVNEIANQLRTLKDATSSDALSALYDKITLMQNENLVSFGNVIEKYALYLETVAQTYEDVDRTLVNQQTTNVDNSKVFK